MGKELERQALKMLYPKSPTWPDRVDKMSDDQVVAIYTKYKAQRKLGK